MKESDRVWWDGGIGCGMSGCYWRNQHNKHHATPQKLGTDPDLQTLPLVAFHKLIGSRGQQLWSLAMAAEVLASGRGWICKRPCRLFARWVTAVIHTFSTVRIIRRCAWNLPY